MIGVDVDIMLLLLLVLKWDIVGFSRPRLGESFWPSQTRASFL